MSTLTPPVVARCARSAPALAIRLARVVQSRLARHRRRTRASLGTLPGIAVEEVRDRSAARRARAVRVHRPGGWIRARD